MALALPRTVASDGTQGQAAARIPRSIAFRYDVLPLALVDGTLTIAMTAADDGDLIDTLRRTTRLKIAPVALPREEIRCRLSVLYATTNDVATSSAERAADAPAVRIVDSIFTRAAAAHASDIHVEPRIDGGGRIRLRIDGVLCELETIGSEHYAAVVSRMKLLAGMDIADKRQPQDGRYTLDLDRRPIDARVSSMPTIDGEKLVVRLLDLHSQACSLEALGMPPAMLAAYLRLVHAPWGFIVVTGPTGSGKTTTLYASLAELDGTANNVCTVEDPIEMRLTGVTQVGVNPRAGLTFAHALRGFMRQDPNVIMVGEMRDAETAAVAISASLAGQLVFTTLHSNDAPRTIERLIELGVARASLAAGLTAIVAQRLVRRLCDRCRREAPIPADTRTRLEIEQPTWWVAAGCSTCAHTGYTGRLGVYELLEIDDTLRDAIGSGASSVTIAQLGSARAYRPMFADGLRNVLDGATSFAELLRVVGRSHR